MKRFALAALMIPLLPAPVLGQESSGLPAEPVVLPDSYANADYTAKDAQLANPDASGTDITQWWQSFDDPLLTELVRKALAQSPTIEIASARIREARAGLVAAKADFLPSLSASGSASHGGELGNSDTAQSTYRVGLDASYELDLFGGVSHSARRAKASYQSSVANLHNAQRVLAAEVALNFIQYRLTGARLAIARDNLTIQTGTRDIVRWREQAGLGSSLDTQQAETQLAQTAASVPALENTLRQSANRLATLAGIPAGTLDASLAPATALPAAPPAVQAGLPSELLARRPDVIAARADLLAAGESIGVARAALYPTLSLGGSITTSATTTAGLFDRMLGSLFANLTTPIFNNGRLKANVRAAQARADIALQNYRSAVLAAYEETRNALSSETSAAARETQLSLAEQGARNALTLANSQYQSGLIDFQKLLEAERALLSAQDNLANARADRSVAAVQLYKALGGGWATQATSQQ